MGKLGALEFWLVAIKLAAIVVFAGIALHGHLRAARRARDRPARHLTDGGGFMPFGASGVWFACCFVIYSFIGVEIVAITSGEASRSRA